MEAQSDWSLLIPTLFSSACYVGFLGFLSWALGVFIFWPLYERVALFRVDHRFRISDLLILGAHLQIVAAAMLALSQGSRLSIKLAVLLGPCVLVAFWWLTGLRMLARAGVAKSGHRWLFLGLVIPAGYLGGLIAVATLLAAPFTLIAMINGISEYDLQVTLATIGIVLSGGLAAITVIACRRCAYVIAQEAREQQARRDGIQFGPIQKPPDARVEVDAADASEVIWAEHSTAGEDRDGIWFGNEPGLPPDATNTDPRWQ